MLILFCLSCIQMFSNSRAASKASQSSSSRTSDSSSCVNVEGNLPNLDQTPGGTQEHSSDFSDLNTQHPAVLQPSIQSLFFHFQPLSLFFFTLSGGISPQHLRATSFQRIQTHRHMPQVFCKSLNNLLALLSGSSFPNGFSCLYLRHNHVRV